MHAFGYAVVEIVMVVVTLGAIWRRAWIPFGLYLLADAVFVYELLRSDRKMGWEDLADLATLFVIVAPLYLVGTMAWIVGRVLRRKRSSR